MTEVSATAHQNPVRNSDALSDQSAAAVSAKRRAPNDRLPFRAEQKGPAVRNASANRRMADQKRSVPKAGHRVLVMSSNRRDEAEAGVGGADGMTDAEVEQLVSVALEGAVSALGDPNPAAFLDLLASEGRAAMHEALASLPTVQATDPTVQEEYQQAIIFQEIARSLALEMVNAFRRYSNAMCCAHAAA